LFNIKKIAMKVTFYILGSALFGALILISKPLPREPSIKFEEKRNELVIKEDKLNQKIIEVESELSENKVMIQIQLDSIDVNKK
jgi:hypothetical protein